MQSSGFLDETLLILELGYREDILGEVSCLKKGWNQGLQRD